MGKIIFEFEKNIRERLALSIFSKKKISILNIRKHQKKQGIRKFEIELFSIIDKLFPESSIEINEAGTIINFLPGLTKKAKVFHKIASLRGISYFVEFILYLLLFNTIRTEIKIEGIRALNLDISLENILFVTFPLMRKIGLRDLRMKIFTNYFSLLYNTELLIFSSSFFSKTGFLVTHPGFFKNIRIVFSFSKNNSFSLKHLENMNNEFQEFHQINQRFYNLEILNKNIFFQTVSLVGESSTGCLFGGDYSSIQKKNINFWKKKIDQILSLLFYEIYKGSCIDGHTQIFFFFKMLCLNKPSQTELNVSNLTLASIEFFRDVKKFTGNVYSIRSKFRKGPVKIELI
mmetsp:Transcript_48059/g.120140  ORF Transcript_48059/g.120140 Transcript_48059/m.120140 type:complete len:346 (-) Transcript_48059:5731-6768(-)